MRGMGRRGGVIVNTCLELRASSFLLSFLLSCFLSWGWWEMIRNTRDPHEGEAHHQRTAHSRVQGPFMKAQNAKGCCINMAKSTALWHAESSQTSR